MPGTHAIADRGLFLRLPEVKRETGLSRTTIYRLEGEGRFPPRSHLSVRAVGWWSVDIDRWKAAREPVTRVT